MTDEDDTDLISLMFEAARSLIGGSKIIISSDGIEEFGVVRKPTLPVIVSSVLAIEIQLKALLQLNGIARPAGNGHDLFLLFQALPEHLQQFLLGHRSVLQMLRVNKLWRY